MKTIKLNIPKTRIKKHLILLCLVPALSLSCEDMLKEEPAGLISMESLNESTLESAIFGIYESATRARGRTFESRYLRFQELQAEYQWGRGGNRSAISDYDFSQSLSDKATMWATFYQSISRANILIDLASKSKNLSEASKNLGIAEAQFLRAIWHYQLVRMFGEVPLRLERVVDKDQAGLALSSIDDIYAAIIADLQFAENNLPNKADPGRATAGAAKAFLAEVYLTRGMFTEARDKAKEVIDNKADYGYDLVQDFSSLWSSTAATNSEDVFSIKFVQIVGFGNFHTTAWSPRVPNVNGMRIGQAAGFSSEGGFESGNASPASSLITEWDNQDIRHQYTLVDSLEVDGAWYEVIPQVTRSIDLNDDGTATDERGLFTFGKYRDPGSAGEFGAGNDFYLMRYADVLLIFAEAENQVNGPTDAAYTALNEVIRRAYSGNTAYDVSGLTKVQFDDEVFKQRGYEFMQEGKRWFDIIRTKRWSVISDAKKPLGNIDQNNPYWFIPDTETSSNTELD